ncbi:MAG: hypothetical protein AAFQ61_06195 [Cyanobacteria bacterium J06626_23]
MLIAMTILTAEEITQLKNQLADYPDATDALQAIEDCDGDVADAALSLALKAGLEPDTNETWLASYAKRFRHVACQEQFRQSLTEHHVVGLISHLTEETTCPALLAAPVALYVAKTGVADFCYSFDNSRV